MLIKGENFLDFLKCMNNREYLEQNNQKWKKREDRGGSNRVDGSFMFDYCKVYAKR